MTSDPTKEISMQPRRSWEGLFHDDEDVPVSTPTSSLDNASIDDQGGISLSWQRGEGSLSSATEHRHNPTIDAPDAAIVREVLRGKRTLVDVDEDPNTGDMVAQHGWIAYHAHEKWPGENIPYKKPNGPRGAPRTTTRDGNYEDDTSFAELGLKRALMKKPSLMHNEGERVAHAEGMRGEEQGCSCCGIQ
ncbi:hypothetical protein BD310DRAFT_480297 [Dichomitus squalens]|uniref:Uncharacterized protein n=1 Tax=Dichomitus squalens TaxID=114155 RepID=A0A4Q9PV89_9APHY|nr:hypothetical protein BD310DRAFT_480297 [Dichomitus squalens]